MKLTRVLFALLDSHSATWARTLTCSSWTELREKLLQKYGLTSTKAKAVILRMKHGVSEKVSTFLDRVDRVAAQADITADWLRENVIPLL